MINDKEFKLAWQAGWDAAIGAHAGVVAAAQAFTNQYMNADTPEDELAAHAVTLISALNNLKTTLKIGLDFR